MNRIALRQLLPATASVLIHLGIVGMISLATGFGPAPVPVLMAELVVVEPPPPVAPPPPPAPPVVRDRRPLTPPKLVRTPSPPVLQPATPPKPEAEPPLPVTPEPPRVAPPEPPPVTTPEPEPPRAAPSEPAPAPMPAPVAAPSPSKPATGPSVTAVPDAGATSFTLPATPTPPPPAGAAAPSTRPSAVAAIPSGSVTQRAIPRGGYQYRPTYPASARNLGIQGTTLLHVLVADDGRVAEVVVKQSAGHADLDRAATDAVRRWRFEPARRGTEPVEMWVQLPFEFRLR
jgi:periplasmic protein TonB